MRALARQLELGSLMLCLAPLAGGGGASVIINVSSDTQIQVATTTQVL